MKNILRKKFLYLGLYGILSSYTLTGCLRLFISPTETHKSTEDLPEEKFLSPTDFFDCFENATLSQTIDVPGESFSLKIDFSRSSDQEQPWTVTGNKNLDMKIVTTDLPENTLVYINEIQMDIYLKSSDVNYGEFLQNSINDYIHNSDLLGFYIDNNSAYYGTFIINGSDQSFNENFSYGNLFVEKGMETEKRYTEKDYLKMGVTDNTFRIVYDLLVKGPNDEDYRNVSAKTSFKIPIHYDPDLFNNNEKNETTEYSRTLSR